MKIAVTSLGETIDSPVDQRFGRCRYIILLDPDTDEYSVHDNKQNLQSAQGAGIQTAQRVVELGAEAVVTGHCGPKAFATLSAGDIQVYQQAEGNVKEAIEAFRNNELEKAEQHTVQSGFGSL